MSAMFLTGPSLAVGGLEVISRGDDTTESTWRTAQKSSTAIVSEDVSNSVSIDTDNDNDNSATDINTTSMSSSPPQSTATCSSHLPSWVLKMRLKIANSRMEHANVESALYNLNQHSMDLDKQLLLLRPVLKAPITIDSILPGSETVDGRSSSYLLNHDVKGTMKPTTITTKICILYLIPDDVLICIMDYLRIKHILMLNQLSKSFQALLNSSSYWLKSFPIYCPHLQRFVTSSSKHLHSSRGMNNMKMMKKKKGHIDDDDDDNDRSGVDYKGCIQSYFRNIYICTSFLQSMKEQRCIPKHKQIAPHRHRKQERQVTHPLPVFDSTNSSSRSSSSSSTNSISSRRGDEQLIMSHAETMSSDYRSIAHKSLTIMLTETNFIDNPLNFKLVNDGVITVLTALLSNEEGALQNYACAIMANLLCWENHNRFVFNIIRQEKVIHSSPLISNEGAVDTTSSTTTTAVGSTLQATVAAAVAVAVAVAVVVVEEEEEEVHIISQLELQSIQKRTFSILSTLQVLFQLNDKDISQIISLSSQITACRGDRQLATLLTSPSASINLAGTFTQVTSDGYKETRRTANVQGMCSQQASRALVGLFYPSMAIPPVAHYTPENNHGSSSSSSSSSNSSCSSSTERELIIDKKRGGSSYNTSSCPPHQQNPFSATAKATDDKVLLLSSYNKKANDDSIDLPSSSSSSSSISSSAMLRGCIPPMLLPIQLRAPCINGIFLSDFESRPWQFTYFYKSGSFKDQFITYLRFFPDNILKGRGIDSIGVFYLKGRAEAGIAGWSWLFDKSYVNSSSIELMGYDTRQWIQLSDDASYNEFDGIGKTVAVHVKHVGYWSDGIDNRDYATTVSHYEDHHRYHYRAQDSKLSSQEEDIGVWGLGLYGVWETCSSSMAHFDLQKGGVFRATPIIVI